MEQKVKIEDFLLKDSQNILRLPCHCKNEQTGGEWDIYPVTVAQMNEMLPYLAAIEKADFDKFEDIIKIGNGEYRLSDYIKFYSKYHDKIHKIVNIAVGKDISAIATDDDYMYMYIATVYRLNSKSFLQSISYAKLLSLSNNVELIAAEKRYMTSLNSL